MTPHPGRILTCWSGFQGSGFGAGVQERRSGDKGFKAFHVAHIVTPSLDRFNQNMFSRGKKGWGPPGDLSD